MGVLVAVVFMLVLMLDVRVIMVGVRMGVLVAVVLMFVLVGVWGGVIVI